MHHLAPAGQTVPPLLSLIIVLPLIVFWLWMFREMLADDDLPSSAREYWLVAFVVLNVVAAAIYYVNVYRNRR